MKLLTFKEFLLEANDNPNPKNIRDQIAKASREIMAKKNVEFNQAKVKALRSALDKANKPDFKKDKSK